MGPARLWWWSCRAHRMGLRPVARLLKALNFMLFKAILPPEADIQPDIEIEHFALGVVVHPNVTLGRRVRIFHHVTLAVQSSIGSDHRIIVGDDVLIGAGAIVLTKLHESLRIGDGAQIGAGAVVVDDVGPHQRMVSPKAVPLAVLHRPTVDELGEENALAEKPRPIC